MKKRPNIIIFNPDSYRGDVLGHMGNAAASTPNLDRLVAHDAVSFRNAFCQNPVCTPSRCSFMSGWYPHVRGHRTMNHMMHEDEPVMLRTLKEAGYFVWWGGKNDLVPAQNGFDEYCDIKYKPTGTAPGFHRSQQWRGSMSDDTFYSFYAGKIDHDGNEYMDSDWANVAGAIEFISNPPTDQPFCVYLPLSFPHPPYAVEEPWYSLVDRSLVSDPIPAPGSFDSLPAMMEGLYRELGLKDWSLPRWRELKSTYYGMCARVDRQFGLVIDALRQFGLYDDTAVFFFSDHGDYTGDYGLVEKAQNLFHDCLTQVPFVVKPPSWIPVKSGVRDALVELIDFPATVEDLTGIEPKHTHFGRSLAGLFTGDIPDFRDAVFCEGGCLAQEMHCGADINAHTQNPEGLYWPRASLQRNEHLELSKAVMCRNRQYKYVMRLYESNELYDLINDPKETNNLIDHPEMKDVVIAMKDQLLRFHVETADVVPFDRDRREP